MRRHQLRAPHRAGDVVDAVRSLVAFHSSDPATVFLSAWARTIAFDAVHLERALYEERSLVRMLGMRRTLWVVPRELVPVVDAAASRAVAVNERRKLEKFVAESGASENPARWVEAAESDALKRVGLDPAAHAERRSAFRNLRHVVVPGSGHMLHHDQPEAVARLLEEFFGG